MNERLARPFCARSALEVAPELLGCELIVGSCAGRIVEVEAYLGRDDPASHAYRGPTARNASMFGPAGHLYVYFTYGMHWCANVVTGVGDGQAVLLRALSPTAGLELMQARRPRARRSVDITNGPAKLCQAFGIDGRLDGVDLANGPVELRRGRSPDAVEQTSRIGIRAGVEHQWRWAVVADPFVSPGRPARPVEPVRRS